jgi:hypothetical protein
MSMMLTSRSGKLTIHTLNIRAAITAAFTRKMFSIFKPLLDQQRDMENPGFPYCFGEVLSLDNVLTTTAAKGRRRKVAGSNELWPALLDSFAS